MTPEYLKQLRGDEGWRDKPYKDSKGVLTIGYGTNLDEGITKTEGDFLLYNRAMSAANAVYAKIPWCRTLDDARLGVLWNMSYNMGMDRLLEFHKFLAAMQAKDWPTAAREMEDSAWWNQVGPRAKRLQQQVLTGQWQFADAAA